MIIINSKVILFFILFIIFLFIVSTYASNIEPDFTEINLITECEITPGNSEKYSIDGPYLIKISNKDFDNRSQIELGFQPLNKSSRKIIAEELKIKYRFVGEDGEGKGWSSWVNLDELPLVINIGDIKRLNLFIKFQVPQSFKIKRGNYGGRFYLRDFK